MMSEPDLQLRDERLNGAIDNTGWPLVRQVQTCARGGSVTLMSQNVFHRRNRRRVRQTLHYLFSLLLWPIFQSRSAKLAVCQARLSNGITDASYFQDGTHAIEDNPRYMWRFMCYRTTEPSLRHDNDSVPASQLLDECLLMNEPDPLTGVVLARDGEAKSLCTTWESILNWARGIPRGDSFASNEIINTVQMRADSDPTGENIVEVLGVQLCAKGSQHEPARIDAAYQLGALCCCQNQQESPTLGLAATKVLAAAMSHSWEGVRRAATHGLIAAGGHCDAAEQALLDLCSPDYPSKYVRKNAAFALGEMAYPKDSVVQTLVTLLRHDDSVHVRATAATALGKMEAHKMDWVTLRKLSGLTYFPTD